MNCSERTNQNNQLFSENTVRLLQRAGWHPNYRIDTGKYIQALEADGHEVFPVVKDFLSRFGGLEVVYWSETRFGKLREIVHFDAAAATAAVYPSEIAEYAEQLAVPLCIIGECNNKHSTLMMDPHGRVYGGYDGAIIFCGESGEQAVENLMTSRQKIKRL